MTLSGRRRRGRTVRRRGSRAPTSPSARGVWRNPDSLPNRTSGLIRLRNECPEIGWGVPTVLEADSGSVLALRYNWRGNALVAPHNLADAPCEVRFRVGVPGGERLHDLMRLQRRDADDGGVHTLVLEGHGYRRFRVGDLNYALTRRLSP